ncbi:Swi3-domain-containing protein [Ophiobolus disseminans]|uniref:Chromosome segregation in meiosis protein n=1 Tax=Ophiobolus disseminans TaxID=1469910 RepID=A0A6A7A5X7_9PLEO|nr:Swi3-domain-containing protein [Ophiobolus disseminans]
MALTSPQTRNEQSDDELDDILNGIVEGRDIPGINTKTQPDFTSRGKAAGGGGDGLGIDEEIIITKKRIPIPKLDDNRLLSDPGIPRLRKISKDRLRFKGKGHEYGDIARMLNMYQLWLDDLYPRAKFADALAMVEKVGHTKRMQMMRKDWIDEGKPRRTTEREEEDVDDIIPDAPSAEQGADGAEGTTRGGTTDPPERGQAQAPEQTGAGADPDEDELDALLAESAQLETSATKTLPVRTAAAEDDPFADEMEAMADMDDMW